MPRAGRRNPMGSCVGLWGQTLARVIGWFSPASCSKIKILKKITGSFFNNSTFRDFYKSFPMI